MRSAAAFRSNASAQPESAVKQADLIRFEIVSNRYTVTEFSIRLTCPVTQIC